MGNNVFYEKSGAYTWDEQSFRQDRVRKLTAELDSLLSTTTPLTVLDVASGSGDFIENIAKRFPQHSYYGSDIAKNVIEQNQKHKIGVKWDVADFNAVVAYDSGKFDIIIAGEIIEHLYDTDNFMLEMKRLLRPGGHLLLTTPNLASWLDRLTLLLGMQPFSTEVSNVSRKFGREKFYEFLKIQEDSPSAGHLRCFTRGALRSIFTFYDFAIEKEIPCSVHEFRLNHWITKVMPGMAQNLFFVARTKTDEAQ